MDGSNPDTPSSAVSVKWDTGSSSMLKWTTCAEVFIGSKDEHSNNLTPNRQTKTLTNKHRRPFKTCKNKKSAQLHNADVLKLQSVQFFLHFPSG